MHFPNQGFHSSLPMSKNGHRFTVGGGSTQSLDFDSFETTKVTSDINFRNRGVLNLKYDYGILKWADVGIGSYSIIPFPSILSVTIKIYQSEKLHASISTYAGYTTFGNWKGYRPIGGTCGEKSELCWDDPNGRWVSGDGVLYSLSSPVGMRVSKKTTIQLVPEIAYFSGKYTLSESLSDTSIQKSTMGLYGIRGTLSLAGLMEFAEKWGAYIALQIQNYDLNRLKTHNSFTVFLGGSLSIDSKI